MGISEAHLGRDSTDAECVWRLARPRVGKVVGELLKKCSVDVISWRRVAGDRWNRETLHRASVAPICANRNIVERIVKLLGGVDVERSVPLGLGSLANHIAHLRHCPQSKNIVEPTLMAYVHSQEACKRSGRKQVTSAATKPKRYLAGCRKNVDYNAS